MKIEYTLTPSQEILQNNAEASKQTLDTFCASYINTALDVVVNAIKDNQVLRIKDIFSKTTVLDVLSTTKLDKVVELKYKI